MREVRCIEVTIRTSRLMPPKTLESFEFGFPANVVARAYHGAGAAGLYPPY